VCRRVWHLHAHEDGSLLPEPPCDEHLSTQACGPFQQNQQALSLLSTFEKLSRVAAESSSVASLRSWRQPHITTNYGHAVMPVPRFPGATPSVQVTRPAHTLRTCSSQPVLSGALAGMDVPHCRHRHTPPRLGCDCSAASVPGGCAAPGGTAEAACCLLLASTAADASASASAGVSDCGNCASCAASAACASEQFVAGIRLCWVLGSCATADWTTMPSHRLAGQTSPYASSQSQFDHTARLRSELI